MELNNFPNLFEHGAIFSPKTAINLSQMTTVLCNTVWGTSLWLDSIILSCTPLALTSVALVQYPPFWYDSRSKTWSEYYNYLGSTEEFLCSLDFLKPGPRHSFGFEFLGQFYDEAVLRTTAWWCTFSFCILQNMFSTASDVLKANARTL